MALSIVMVALCILTAGLFLVVRIKKGGVWGLLTKTLASFAFVITGFVALSRYGTNLEPAFTLMVIGLLCGLLGDILLDLKVVYSNDKNKYLNFGMLSFGLGHIAYLAGISLILVNLNKLALAPYLWSVLAAAILTTVIMLVSKKLKLNFGKFLIQTIAYCFILTFMFVYSIFFMLSVDLGFIFMLGMLLFLLSDLVLSMMYFAVESPNQEMPAEKNPILIFTNHSLYYCAQILIVIFMLFF